MGSKAYCVRLALLGILLQACSPVPVPPSQAPAALGCEHSAEPGSGATAITLAGWLGDDVVLAFADASCAYQPATGTWLGVAGDRGGAGPAYRARWTDGASWASVEDDGTLEVSLDGDVRRVRPAADAAWLGEWGTWNGELLQPVNGYGYVVPLVGSLVHLTHDGELSDTALPGGLVTLSVGSDGSALVRDRPDPLDPTALNDPFALFRWRPGTAEAKLVATAARGVYGADPPELAWVTTGAGEIQPVQPDGALGPSIGRWNPAVERVFVSPSGRVVVHQPLDGGTLLVEERPSSATEQISEACGPIVWRGDTFACLAAPTQPSPQPWVLVVRAPGEPAAIAEIH